MRKTKSIDEFARNISVLANKFSELGATIKDATLIKKLFDSVPNKYLQVVASLKQLLNMETMLFEEVIGRLKAYEERIQKGDGHGEHLLHTYVEWTMHMKKNSGESSKRGTSSSKGHGQERGCGSGRGRGKGWRGSFNMPRQLETGRNGSNNKDKSHIKCINYDKMGYYTFECWSKQHEEKANLTHVHDEEPVLMLIEV